MNPTGISDQGKKTRGSLMAPMPNRSIVDRIMTRITNAIINGELKPGQRIPTENELCESMQVGRNSVREAIKALVAMGVLNIRRAEGTFVAEGFSDRMLDPMVYGLILEGGNSNYLIELRRMLEVGILNLAIKKATEVDIARIQQAFDNLRTILEQTHPSIDQILEADILFHKALEQTVHNPLVDKISAVVERLSRPTRARTTKQLIENHEQKKISAMHEQIVSVVANRDEAAVAGVIDEHYRYWKDEVK